MRSYRRQFRKLERLFAASLFFYGLMPAMILFIPLTSRADSALTIWLGALFWVSFLCGTAASYASSQIVRDRLAVEKRFKVWRRRLPGAICFLTCRAGEIADGILAICVIATIVIAFLEHTYYVVFYLRAISLAALIAHCVFNGRTYDYIRRFKKKEGSYNEKSRHQFE